MSLQVWLPLNDGTLRQQGLNPIVPTLLSGTSFTAGKLGQGLYNSGDGQGINLPNYMTQLKTYTTYSMMAWVYLDAQATNHSSTIISSGNWNTVNGQCCFGLYSYSSGYGVILCPNRSDWSNGISYSSKVVLNKWYHIAITYNGTKTIAYVNGDKVGEYNSGGICQNSETNNVYIGSATYYSGFTLKGKINDVRIYNNCLSPQEIKEISKGLVVHYPLHNSGWGNENFILKSQYVTGGGNASGITRTYEADGSMKIVAASGNSNWCSLSFPADSNLNVRDNLQVGDTYTISCDVKVASGTSLPTLFINSGNGYKRLLGTIIPNKWIRAYYTSTWAEPGTQYGNISLHLGFSGISGTYYFKNFKLEKGNKPTPWCPSSIDALGGTTMNVPQIREYDISGFGNNGTKVNGGEMSYFDYDSDSPKYAVSTTISDGNLAIVSPRTLIRNQQLTSDYTVAFWIKPDNNASSVSWIYGGLCDFSFRPSGPYISYSYGTGTSSTSGSALSIDTNQWYHIAIVYSQKNATVTIYKNGTMHYTYTNRTTVYPTSEQEYLFGNGSPGLVSDLRVYTTALSADDIKSLYQNEATFDDQGNILGPIR